MLSTDSPLLIYMFPFLPKTAKLTLEKSEIFNHLEISLEYKFYRSLAKLQRLIRPFTRPTLFCDIAHNIPSSYSKHRGTAKVI